MRDTDTRGTRPRCDQRGFTLTEMMVVMAVIAIMSAIVIGISTRTYGVNATVFSEQLTGSLNLARTRALMTRKIQRVAVHLELSPPELQIWQANTAGMAATNITTARFVERVRVPTTVTMWAAVTGAQASGQNPSQTASELDIDFYPDGSATAATLYVTDPNQSRKTRVLVYHATGSAYVRQAW
jgi:prepilin-type N-terminal cleavage/methylation domain-containing protein